MSATEQTDHFFELFEGLRKQGPGSVDSTLKALSFIPQLTGQNVIADIGCGTGLSTLTLARNTPATIKAFDLHQPFLDSLKSDLKNENLERCVDAIQADMNKLPLADQSVDLIWSEAAAYIMGFGQALQNWKKFLKPGGYIAISELTWLTDKPAPEALDFWNAGYPAMQTLEQNTALFKTNYELVTHFILPKSDWNDGYYSELEIRIKNMRQKYSDNIAILQLLTETKKEIDIWKKHNDEYGYVFYIGKLN